VNLLVWVTIAALLFAGCAAAPPRCPGVRFSPVAGYNDSFYLADQYFAVSTKRNSEIRLAIEHIRNPKIRLATIEDTSEEVILFLACKNRSSERRDFLPDQIRVEEIKRPVLKKGEMIEHYRPLLIYSKRAYTYTAKIKIINEAQMVQMAEAFRDFLNLLGPQPSLDAKAIAGEVRGIRSEMRSARMAKEYAEHFRAVTSQLLGRETLSPGETVFGQVRATPWNGPKLLRIIIPFGNDSHVIEFICE